MSKKYLLALDVGTSGCKVTLFDFQGKVIANQVMCVFIYIAGISRWWG